MISSPILLIIFCGIVDRIRGDGFGPGRFAELMFYGWIVSTLLGYPLSWETLAFSLLFTAGGWTGWPMSYVYDDAKPWKPSWWAKWSDTLSEGKFPTVIVRGLIWALPMMAMYKVDPVFGWAAASMFVAFPLSQIVTKKIKDSGRFGNRDWWGFMEWFRGLLFGGLIAIGVV